MTDARATVALEHLAYSLQTLADATGLSDETIRQAVLASDLIAKKRGRKYVIEVAEAKRWLKSLPDAD